MKKIVVCSFVLVMLLASIVQPGFSAGEKEVNLLLMHDKVGNPDYQPFFLNAAAEVKAKLGINIVPIGYPTTDVYSAALRAALPTPKAPDIFTWWYRYWAKGLIDEGLLVETTDIWDKYQDEFDPGIRNAYTFGGNVYGISWGADYWIQYYNKDVFNKLNLSVPTTWDEFLELCDTLKQNGVTPINQTIDKEWPAFITFQELCARVNAQLYEDIVEGRAKYTDPEAREVFALWQDMMNKGYFSEPTVDYFNDVPRMFNEDKLGIILGGTWYYKTQLLDKGVPASKIGIFLIPPVKPETGDGIIVELSPIFISKNTENLESALKVADYWMSPEGNTFLSKQIGNFPCNLQADASYLPPIMNELRQTIIDGDFRLVNRYWEATPTEIMLKINQKFAEFILKPEKMDQILADIQSIADEYWAKAQK